MRARKIIGQGMGEGVTGSGTFSQEFGVFPEKMRLRGLREEPVLEKSLSAEGTICTKVLRSEPASGI